MNILIQILIIFAFAIVALALYYGIKVVILDKFKVKKRYLIAAFALILLFPFIALIFYKNVLPQWVYSIQMVLVTVVFLAYLEVRKAERIERSKPVIGRPKPKPNRVKNK